MLMARLNGLVTISRRGVYWQLIDYGGPDVLTIAVANQTPQSLKELLRAATVPGIWAPEDAEYEPWTFDLDVMKEHANTENTSSGFPSWVGGRVSAQPSTTGNGVRFDITPVMLR
jgi:hypothetical protein